jgi:type IV pilus assembly protein PilB
MTTTTITPVKRKSIGQLLVDKGYVTQAQIEQVLADQKNAGQRKLLGELLVETGVVTDEQVVETLAESFNVPYAKASPRICDPRVIEVLPRDFLEKHIILPMFLVNGTLTVAMAEPSNLFIIEEIQRMTGHTVQVVASIAHDIHATLQTHLPNANVFVIDELIEDVKETDFSLVENVIEDISELKEVAGHSPVIKLVNYLLFQAVRDGASDIHIEPDEKKTRVRYRVDGRLFEKICPPHQMHAAIISRLKIMAGLDISERRLPQDGGIHVRLEGRPIDLRVSTMPEKFGEKAVIRIIDNRSTAATFEKLGFEYAMLEDLKKVIEQPHGIVLVTGPTGSGKSTSLYACLQAIARADVNICTVEDPVENSLTGINQFQVNDKIGFSFAAALRSLLRQDPDVIMVGEIRDAETARIAVQAALTGHLVLSTLHTNDAPSSITRLVNMGIESYLIAASLRAVLAQRLVRRICSGCKEAYDPPANIRHGIEKTAGPFETLFRGKGCKKCRNSGFAGRIGIYELLLPDADMLEAIAEGATISKLRQMCKDRKIPTLRADGMTKVKAGVTTYEEVLRATAL